MIDSKGNPVLPLTKLAVNAIAHALKSRDPKGWEVRMSGKILRGLGTLTVLEKRNLPGIGDTTVELVKDGNLTLNIEQYKFLRSAVMEVMNNGAQGIAIQAEGYDDLCDVFDNLDAELKQAEDK